MINWVESTDRRPTDYFHFGVTCLGVIIHVAGVVTTSLAAAICGLVLIAFGLAYFVMQDAD
ncbi:MAG TPA: hypothetical protein VGI88_13095 [Verrucomicrobiae bacterium]|jgi:hypothetical protein